MAQALFDGAERLDVFFGWQREEHGVSLDLDWKDPDLVILAAVAASRLERKGLLVQWARDLRSPLLIAQDATRQHHLTFVRAKVFAGVPLVPAGEPENRDLRPAVLDGATALDGKVADMADPHPAGRRGFGRRGGGRDFGPDELVDGHEIRGPVGRPLLAPLGHKLDARFSQLGVGELLEEPPLIWIVDDRLPLALVTVDERLQLPLQLVGDAKPIVDDHVPEEIDSPFHLFQPYRCTGEPVGRLDVVHEKPVDVLQGRLFVEVGGEQIGVAGMSAAVAADVEVPAFFGRDQAEILALRLGTLADAARDRRLELVRRPDPSIAHLDPDRETDGVLHAVTAPGRADAALDGANGLAVGVTALESGGDQVGPDVGQEMNRCAEHVDALAAGDLGVETVLAGDFAQHDQLFRRDLTAGNARDDGVQSTALNVGEEPVVRVLKRGDAPARGRFRSKGWRGSTRRPACRLRSHGPVPWPASRSSKRLEPLDLDDLKQLLAAMGKVLAEVVADVLAGRLQLRLEQVGDLRQTAAAAGAGPGACLDLGDRGEPLRADGVADLALADVVARADLGVAAGPRSAAD